MKKILSLMLAFVLVLSMSVTAFAADGQGSITITNATIGQSYSVYKLFDATYNADAEGNTNAVSYSIDDSNQFFAVLFGADGTTPTISLTMMPSQVPSPKNPPSTTRS